MRPITLSALALVLAACPSEPSEPTVPPANVDRMAQPPSNPASAPANAPSIQLEPDPGIKGKLVLAEGAEVGEVSPDTVIYLMARRPAEGGGKGALVAVKRLDPGPFPLEYELTSADVMMKGTPFVGPFAISARLDRDGDAMTRGADDLYADAAGPVDGGEELDLTLAPRSSP